jgi:hypothetical protein
MTRFPLSITEVSLAVAMVAVGLVVMYYDRQIRRLWRKVRRRVRGTKR